MRWNPRAGGAPSAAVSGRVEGARRATVLRYGGSLWVNGYWSDTTMSIEVRPIRRSVGRVLLVGPPFGVSRSVALDLAPGVGIERLAEELADWIETPALGVRRAERTWSGVARGIAAALNGGTFEGVSA